ncbi:hypothetical protein JQ633_01080 [Bradyrhizobium tropiciagri]|uniref:hypothetical protein n=1 Tax=Bradyrhizobium tropiciagri TaxID=312253 RepID=UPI001BAC6E53|nr:hypothetical protein [Bradyrhizobium tropiciagri]MBR0868934.1 hypothetical protein [Bradyrhizobium tropiciagri]
MAETLNPADWGATPAESPADWGAVAVGAPQQQSSMLPAAIADVPGEIKSAAGSAIDKIAALRNRGGQGPIEGLMTTGRAVLAVPELAMSPVTGAARSLIGHPMADLQHKVGELIAPDIAAKDDPQKMYETAKGDVDLAMAGARAGTPKAPTVTTPSVQELKAASEAAYKSPEVLGLEVKPSAYTTYSTRTQQALNQEGFDDIVAPKTFQLLQRIEKAPEGSVVTGQNINSLRKTLGKLAGSNDPTERAAASFAIDHLDDFIPNIARSDIIGGDAAAAAAKLEEARGNWSAAKQAEKLDKKIVKAEMQADTSNSGMNLENRIRSQMGRVAIDEREARGLNASEIEQARKIAQGTRLQNALRTAGNVLGGGGGLGAVVTGIPSAGLAPAVGFALKLLSNGLTMRQAEGLSTAVRMRAPLASSVEKFGEAIAKYRDQQSPSAYAGAVVAARNLSSNLQGTGIESSIGSLLRSLAVPGQSPAEDDQEVPRRK